MDTLAVGLGRDYVPGMREEWDEPFVGVPPAAGRSRFELQRPRMPAFTAFGYWIWKSVRSVWFWRWLWLLMLLALFVHLWTRITITAAVCSPILHLL